MADLADRIRSRIVPALLTALGVTLLAAGLLSITNTVTADPGASPSPSADVAVISTPSPRITLPPLGSGRPVPATPSIPAERVATRVAITALGINLPVVAPPDGYPFCNVAMFLEDPRLGQPGEGRATYLFAHARKGMFLPILNASKVSRGKGMLGMVVEVWTSDDQYFMYQVTKVIPHVPSASSSLDPALTAKTEQLWLQTSEGVGSQPKLQVVAEPLIQLAASHADAHPKPNPVVCQ
jgi:hypothetical protein